MHRRHSGPSRRLAKSCFLPSPATCSLVKDVRSWGCRERLHQILKCLERPAFKLDFNPGGWCFPNRVSWDVGQRVGDHLPHWRLTAVKALRSPAAMKPVRYLTQPLPGSLHHGPLLFLYNTVPNVSGEKCGWRASEVTVQTRGSQEPGRALHLALGPCNGIQSLASSLASETQFPPKVKWGENTLPGED